MDISIQSHVYIILQEIHDELHGFSITVGLQGQIRLISVENYIFRHDLPQKKD